MKAQFVATDQFNSSAPRFGALFFAIQSMYWTTFSCVEKLVWLRNFVVLHFSLWDFATTMPSKFKSPMSHRAAKVLSTLSYKLIFLLIVLEKLGFFFSFYTTLTSIAQALWSAKKYFSFPNVSSPSSGAFFNVTRRK